MQKILIVEDDKKLRQELETFLNKNGFQAKGLEKFNNTIQDILNEKADLVLLDINLPYADGEFVCKEVRKLSNVPIIMVTSRDNEIDELMSLNYGADQYVTKPYNIQILLAYNIGIIAQIYIAIIIILVVGISIFVEYKDKQYFYNQLKTNMDELNEKYLISEIIKTPNFIEGKILKETIQDTGKSMLENVNYYKNIQEEYKEYIELWIHEVKIPIAASKMIIENNKNAITKK